MKQSILHFSAFISIFAIVFSSKLSDFIRDDIGIDKAVAGDLIKLISVSLLIYVIKTVISRVMKTDDEKIQSIKDLSNDVSNVSTTVKTLETKHDLMNKQLHSIYMEVYKTSSVLNGLDGMRLDKIRWNDEFDADWKNIEESFKELDKNTHFIAKLIKEAVKDIAFYLFSVDKNQSCETILNKFSDQSSFITEKFEKEIIVHMDHDEMREFCSSINKHKVWCRIEVAKTLNDKINHRNEAIQITMRQFMRRILNAFYVSRKMKSMMKKEQNGGGDV